MPFEKRWVYIAIPTPLSPQQQGKLNAWENATKAILKDAVIINEGKANEEPTKTFQKHICNHDIGKPCPPWEDI